MLRIASLCVCAQKDVVVGPGGLHHPLVRCRRATQPHAYPIEKLGSQESVARHKQVLSRKHNSMTRIPTSSRQRKVTRKRALLEHYLCVLAPRQIVSQQQFWSVNPHIAHRDIGCGNKLTQSTPIKVGPNCLGLSKRPYFERWLCAPASCLVRIEAVSSNFQDPRSCGTKITAKGNLQHFGLSLASDHQESG